MSFYNKSLAKTYVQIAWPAAIEGFLIILLSSIDLLMISSLGEEAVAAVGVFFQPRMSILIFARAFAVSITQVTAMWCVSEKVKELPVFLKQCTTIGFIGSLGILLLTSFFMKDILYLAGAEDSYINLALEYTMITNISLFFFSISIVLNAALTGLGNTRAMLASNVIGNIVNLILNYFFIYLFAWGVKGAAIATLTGSIVTFIVTIYFVNRNSSPIALKGLGDWLPTAKYFNHVKATFFSTFTEQASERFGMFVYTSFVAGLGVLSFSTHCICMLFCDVFYNFGQGFSKASLTISSNLRGKNKISNIYVFAKTILPISIVIGSVAAMFFLTMGKELISLYTADAEIIELGTTLLMILSLSTIPQAISLSYSGILRGVGYAKYVAKYSFYLVAVARPIVTYLVIYTFGFGIYGAWFIIAWDQATRAFLASMRFIGKKKLLIPPASR